MRRRAPHVVALVLGLGAATVSAQEVAPVEPEPAPEAPAPAPAPGYLEVGGFQLTPSLDLRFRAEARGNRYTNAGPLSEPDHFVTTRARVGLQAVYGPVTALVQFQDTRNFGTAPGADDGGTFALHQGYVQLANETGYVRVGRQEINLGDQRMIGALDWLMGARSFDAVRLHGDFDRVHVDLFGAMNAPRATYTDPLTMESETSQGDYLGIAHLTWDASESSQLDTYVLYRHEGPRANALGRDNHIVAPGVRATGSVAESLRYTVEGTFQVGDRAGQRHLAYAFSGDLGYRFGGASAPTLSAGFALGSGQSESGNVDEFDNFFPTNHKFYGLMDFFGLRNVIDAHAGFDLKPTSDLALGVEVFSFALQQDSARWSNAGGATIGQDATGGSRSLGQELDLTAQWKATRGVALVGGYSLFVPNAGAERLGQDEISHWAWMMLVVRTP